MDKVMVVNGQVCVATSVLEEYKTLQEFKEKANALESELRNALLNAMEENGIKKFENDVISVSYIAPGTRKSIDKSLLERDGIYDRYCSESTTSASVRIKLKNEK